MPDLDMAFGPVGAFAISFGIVLGVVLVAGIGIKIGNAIQRADDERSRKHYR